MKNLKAGVTMRALIQRINRKLSTDQEVLKKTRGERACQDLGDYYVLNVNRNWIVGKDVAPEALGRKLGVLSAWEAVIDENE
jgi:hypothetical protein